jgi:hypothetical protein
MGEQTRAPLRDTTRSTSMPGMQGQAAKYTSLPLRALVEIPWRINAKQDVHACGDGLVFQSGAFPCRDR